MFHNKNYKFQVSFAAQDYTFVTVIKLCFNRNHKFNIVSQGSKILLVHANITFKLKKSKSELLKQYFLGNVHSSNSWADN